MKVILLVVLATELFALPHVLAKGGGIVGRCLSSGSRHHTNLVAGEGIAEYIPVGAGIRSIGQVVAQQATGGGEGRNIAGVVWYVYRGTGQVSFAQTEPKLDKDGKASTTATFKSPPC